MTAVLRLFMTTLTCAAMLVTATPVFAQQNPNTYLETRISTLEEQLRILNGQIEQVGFSVKRLDQAVQRMQSDFDARLTKLESDTAALQTAQTTQASAQAAQQAAAQQAAIHQSQQAAAAQQAAEQPVPDIKGTLGALKTQNGKVVGGVNNPKAPPLPDAPPDYGLTPQEQYDRAFDLLRKADYPEAEKAFKGFIEKNPKEKLLDNAKYWYGETLYVQNKYNDSAVAFVDSYQQNPKGTKAPDSLLKLGLSLSALSKTSDACTTLLELKEKYPKASASVRSRANEEIGKLKCKAPQQ